MTLPTPGPWLISEQNPINGVDARISATNGQAICTLFRQANGDANARLIAEAPEMLEIVREFVETAADLDSHRTCEPECHVWKARALLARIEGHS